MPPKDKDTPKGRDIRSFFGGKPTATPIREKEPKEEDSKKKRVKSRKIIDDSDDDTMPEPKKATPKPAPKKAVQKNSPVLQETSTSDYFASSSKPKASKSTPSKSKPQPAPVKIDKAPTPRRAPKSYAVPDDDDAFLDDDKDAGDDIFAADVKNGRRSKDEYVESDGDEEIKSRPKRVVTNNKRASTTSKKDLDVEMKDVEDDKSDEFMVIDEPETSKSSKKRKSVDLESDSDNDIEAKPTKSKSTKQPPAKKQRAPAKKKEPEVDSSAVQAILDNIPTVRAPTPPPKDPNFKFDFKKAGGAGNAGASSSGGSVDLPTGAENCLAGMTFVFTGLLQTLQREDGQNLVKRYGGKVTGAPSSKTSFVVLGDDAGPSKLRKIEEMKIRTINEVGLFALIKTMPANGGDGKAAEKNNEKKKLEEDKVKKAAEDMEKEEERRAKEAKEAEKARQKQLDLKGVSAPAPVIRPIDPTSQLWTSKYAPTSMAQICGNKGQVDKISTWLKGWSKAHKYNFQMRGPEGLGGARAIMIHGPPGIGKTTAAHLAAKIAGYDVIESNASDTRSKKMVESGLAEILDNKSLLGYFAGDGKIIDKQKKKIVLIMDEVDGMSAGDRGGVGAMAKVCKTTHIPLILICNDRRQQKMKPFDHVTLDFPFRRPTVDQIKSRIATICHREGLKIPLPVIEALIEGSNKDIRQIINMISTVKLDQKSLDFDEGKSMSKAWEKHVVLKPFDLCHKLLSTGMFAPASKATLNDKIELYFNDHEFAPLMVQENYLSTKMALASNADSPKEARLRSLQLADQAAESISDGDLVDRMIHGSQQQWSLMPTHAVFSSVRPASFIHGSMTGQTVFSKWLGNNSKYGKLTRYIKEIQSHMRLRCSGDRHEIRQQYLPVLWNQLVKRLEVDGKDAVEDVIELMDSYFLTKEDWDFILELGLGHQAEEDVKLESQTKATFTRLYNSRSHPLPFMKAGNIFAPAAKLSRAAPDLEEAIEAEDEEEEPVPKAKEEDDEIDLKKDKYIKLPKAKKPAAAKKKTASKKKGVKNDDDEEEEDEEDVKPKKTKARGKAKK